MYQLTEGALDKIMSGIDIEKPIVQVLGHKKLASANSDRFRLLVSDGLKTNSFIMLATQLNHLVTDNVLSEFTICGFLKYALSTVNNSGKEKRVIIVLDMEIIASGEEVGHKIGNPIITYKLPSESETAEPHTSEYRNGAAQKNISILSSISEGTITPIAALSPYQNKWVIKARVLTKSQVRTYSNARGAGKLFTIELVDESGEIRCTAFNKQCDDFYDLMEPKYVYYITRCTLKPANKQFNTMKNDFEMTMNNDTDVKLCEENIDDIPTLQFNFSPISHLEHMQKDDIIDILAVVTTCGEVNHIVSQRTGKEHTKRDVHVVDNSGVTISVTLWGKQAEEFDGSNNPIVAIKSARVGEFNGGKNLSLGVTSILEKNPDIPEAHKLRGWYTASGHLENAKSLSRSNGASGSDANTPLYTFQEAADAKLGERMDITDVFSVVANINMIRMENSIYKACPADGCKKKLIEQSKDRYRCEKCNNEYPSFSYRLLATMNVGDATGTQWITAFNDEAEKILGMTAKKLGGLKESDNDAYQEKLSEANFKKFVFGLRVKSEMFQDEVRKRYTCVSVSPVSYKTYLPYLVNKVFKLGNIEQIKSEIKFEN